MKANKVIYKGATWYMYRSLYADNRTTLFLKDIYGKKTSCGVNDVTFTNVWRNM